VKEHTSRIERVDSRLGAFTTLCFEDALAAARDADRAYELGRPRALEGIPYAVKDMFDSAGVRTTYGSSMFAENVPSVDARAVARAKSAGAIMVGKTLTHELAWGITGENPHFGPSRNPWLLDRISGGSSGGSAVAVATHQVPLALGSDTGGSVRNPASFCGVVGMKPTFGRIGTEGLFALAPSLDHVGVLARTPRDAALFLGVLADDLSVDALMPAGPLLPQSAGIRVGLGPVPGAISLAPAVKSVFDQARKALEASGVITEPVALEGLEHALEIYNVLQASEALDVHRRAGLYPARRDEYGADVLARLDSATEITSEQRRTAERNLQAFRADLAGLFRSVDVLMTPVSPIAAPVRGSDTTTHDGEIITLRDLIMPFTVPQDLSRCPACAVRAGFASNGLPIGMQFTAPFGRDDLVLRVAQMFYEQTQQIQQRWPAVIGLHV